MQRKDDAPFWNAVRWPDLPPLSDGDQIPSQPTHWTENLGRMFEDPQPPSERWLQIFLRWSRGEKLSAFTARRFTSES